MVHFRSTLESDSLSVFNVQSMAELEMHTVNEKILINQDLEIAFDEVMDNANVDGKYR